MAAYLLYNVDGVNILTLRTRRVSRHVKNPLQLDSRV